MNVLPAQPIGIQSTAGAVPIRNEKGNIITYDSNTVNICHKTYK